EINSEIPDWLCAIVEKLHAKKPTDRIQTAKEVGEFLAKYLSEMQLYGQVASVVVTDALRDPGQAATPPGASARAAQTPPRPANLEKPTAPAAARGRGFRAAVATLLLLAISLIAWFWGHDLVLLATNRGTLEFDVTADGVVLLDTRVQAVRKGMGEVTII